MKSMKSMESTKSMKKNLWKGAICTRTSSKTNKQGASISRQKEAAQRAAAQQQTAIVKTASNKQITKIYFESVRALSRDATVAEQMYQQSKKANVQMTPNSSSRW